MGKLLTCWSELVGKVISKVSTPDWTDSIGLTFEDESYAVMVGYTRAFEYDGDITISLDISVDNGMLEEMGIITKEEHNRRTRAVNDKVSKDSEKRDRAKFEELKRKYGGD